MKKAIIFLLFPALTFLLASCGGGGGGNGASSSPMNITLNIPNQFQNYYKSTGSGKVSFKVKVKVQTLDGNNNAVQYKNNTYATISSATNTAPTISVSGVQIPQSGKYVIQVWQTAQDCHWNDSRCSGVPARNNYFAQQTFNSPSSVINFYGSFSLDDWDCC